MTTQDGQKSSLAKRLKPKIRPLSRLNARAALAESFDSDDRAILDRLSETTAAFLSAIADHSPYLLSLMRRDVADALAFLDRPPEVGIEAALEEARSDCLHAQGDGEIMAILRRMKRRVHLLIALADIGGVWDVVEVTERITQMADSAVSLALNYLLREAAAQGKISLADPEQPGNDCGVVILALGKHGSRELNYSSDVDLVVFYDPQSPALRPDVEPSQLFVRVTRALVKILQERTGDGYVLRVDLRLRPDPGSTSVAISLPAAFDYYESLGQNWERAAFIKARPIAGDLEIGAQFIRDLAPFIWRRYFDYAAIADIHAMKRQIHAVRGHAEIAVAGHDVKLGRGGIREVEFFVQTQQLVFGGRRPQLRGARTLDMLAELHRDGWVGEDAVRDLSASYKYLRTIEHRLQMTNDEQTQRLPLERKALENFARFCGYANASAFAKELTAVLKAVEFHYARLFEDAPDLAGNTGSLVFTGTSDDPETLDTLRNLGFADPSKTIETVRGWHFGRRAAVQSARAREVLTELVPALIEAFAGSGDPDAALAAFDTALARMPAAVELFSILKSNQAMRELFGDILGGAPRLAEVIARKPHVLDAAIDPALWDASASSGNVIRRLDRLLASAPAMEDFLDSVRDIYQEESFLIGVRLLSASIDARDAGRAYSDLAGAIVSASLSAVLRDFSLEHGVVQGARCVVLGLGKLGSREMTATSDLDIIVLYDFKDASPDSNGQRPLHAAQYYARIAQRLISALTVSTRRGALYDVDMRLRPSGKQGPVATRLSSFREYQNDGAETWEHMALTRARFVAGDATLAEDIFEVIRNVVNKPRDKAALASDVAAMRKLIAQEKGEKYPWDLKLAAGGLIDLEFIIQYLILGYGRDDSTLIELMLDAPEKIYPRAATHGWITPAQADELVGAYRTLATTMQMIRLATAGAFHPESTPRGVLKRIAAALNLPEFRQVEAELLVLRRQVRGIFKAMLG